MKNHDGEGGTCWGYLILILEAPQPKLSNNSECLLLTFKKSALTLVCDSTRMYTEQRVESSDSFDFCLLLSDGFAVFGLLAMNSPNIIVPLNSCLNCVNNTSLAD